MAAHVAPLQGVRQDVWHGPLGPALALALVVLPFAVALVWFSALPRLDEATVASHIRATAGLVDEHAAAMIGIGERVREAAAVSTAADRDVWLAYGAHMVSDGEALRALGERLRGTATVAGADPMHRGTTSVAVAALQARWEQLRADGRATAEHGRVMVEQARRMTAGVGGGIVTAADARELEEASAGMVEAGGRIVRAADMLLATAGQMQRWMGFAR